MIVCGRRMVAPELGDMNHTNFVLVGNPGVGKSAILNGLTGTKNFPSGISIGAGLTSQLAMFKYDGDVYMDTPGLSDIELRREAAVSIKKAMSRGGKFKLFFVLTIEAGRCRPADVMTMKLV